MNKNYNNHTLNNKQVDVARGVWVYNTLTRKKEEFKTIKSKIIKMYVCGPTVYGPSHLGHARTYIIFDFIRRFLGFLKYRVKFVMNITDIHDDILKEANRLKIPPQKLSEQYSNELFQDLKILRIKKAFRYPRVSGHIKDIIKIIKILIKKDYAYETEDGVYFRVSSLKNYSQLSARKIENAVAGTRIKTDTYDKEEIADFALWKKEKDKWLFNSPWGKGRPGWHIECSAMSKKYLGIPFDIHAGAMDLIFPHHENEIAQSQSAFDKKFVNYFLHSGLLYVDGKKMSKSLGNFTTINDSLKKYPARFLRFFILSHHWRSIIDFNEKTINNAWSNYLVINAFVAKCVLNHAQTALLQGQKSIGEFKQKFMGFLKDDFNSAGAINYLLEFINQAQTHPVRDKTPQASATPLAWVSNGASKDLLKQLKEFDKFFVCFFPWIKLNAETKNLINQREKLREEKDYNEADKIRKILQEQGIILEDLKDPSKISGQTKTLIVNLN